MAVKKLSLVQRVSNWAGDRLAMAIWAGRTRKMPERETTVFARLMNLGSMRFQKDRPLIKPTPSNLRKFGRTVYARRAINRVKGAVASLKWEIVPKANVKLTPEIKRQIEIVTSCFNKPNHDDSFRTMIEQAGEDYLSFGAAAIEQEVGGDKMRPLWMWPVDASSIQVYAGWTGDKNEARYSQTLGYGNVGGVQGIPLTNDQLIYIRKDPNTNDPFGIGCLEIAFNSISRLLGVSDYAGNVASNGAPRNMLVFKGADKSTLESMRGWWRDEVEGQGEVPMLGGDGAEVLKLHEGKDDALYLKYQEMLIREIATAFEISPQDLSIEADVNRSTAEVSDDRDWSGAIIPMATNFSAYLTREAIEGKLGFSQIELKFLGLDREDEEATAKIFETYYKNNAMTPDEQRARLGLPPIESKWGSLTYADVQLAIAEKRSPGEEPINNIGVSKNGK
ncbi:phage portal protein [Sideroxydans lithotrophicus]|uniref:Portal protein n=1 Tax=Sideroxydans lithotrophicus (strain ES-1) TaxID=580332 RepID=D5CT64_SIDLE|nr:phage portal protein [Sideroxydans lithotrophicus]ADE12150.1 portal protein [Sideroxydans lithotrophicus ES-1]